MQFNKLQSFRNNLGAIDGNNPREVARYDMGNRIREVEQGPDGAIWVVGDRDGGRLLKLTPRGDFEAD